MDSIWNEKVALFGNNRKEKGSWNSYIIKEKEMVLSAPCVGPPRTLRHSCIRGGMLSTNAFKLSWGKLSHSSKAAFLSSWIVNGWCGRLEMAFLRKLRVCSSYPVSWLANPFFGSHVLPHTAARYDHNEVEHCRPVEWTLLLQSLQNHLLWVRGCCSHTLQKSCFPLLEPVACGGQTWHLP